MNLMRSVTLNGSKCFLFEMNQKQIFLFDLTLSPSLVMSESEKTGDESETAENVEDMVTTTRSGITNWRVSKYR
jgi:hypothetical protein